MAAAASISSSSSFTLRADKHVHFSPHRSCSYRKPSRRRHVSASAAASSSSSSLSSFRPCIDIHGGKVKQIVGASLQDNDATATLENFSTDDKPSTFATKYRDDQLPGGHVIMLGKSQENADAARDALAAFPGGLHVGGGITDESAAEWIEAGASHVIVTSYAFTDGMIDLDKLARLRDAVGKERVVIDLSCKRVPSSDATTTSESSESSLDDASNPYCVCIDRWQTVTDVRPFFDDWLARLAEYCDEFLVHAVANEGLRGGIDEDLVRLLAATSPIPVTYAGGVRDVSDLERFYEVCEGKVDVTVGSALDIFGGELKYDDVVDWHKRLRM